MKKCLVLLITMLFGLVSFAGSVLATGLPAIELNPAITADNLCQDLTDNMQAQLLSLMSGDPLSSGMELETWVAKFEGDPETLFTNTEWPEDTVRNVMTQNMGEALQMSIDWYSSLYTELWGEDWTSLATQKVNELKDREMKIVLYETFVPPMTGYAIQVMSPYIDTKTLTLYEGTYVVVLAVTLSEVEGLEDAYESELDVLESFPVDFPLGEWVLEAGDEEVSIVFTEYLGGKNFDGYYNDFYSGVIRWKDYTIIVDSIPEDILSMENCLRVENVDGYSSFYIYVEEPKTGCFFYLASMTPVLQEEIGVVVALSDDNMYYETEDLDYMTRK